MDDQKRARRAMLVSRLWFAAVCAAAGLTLMLLLGTSRARVGPLELRLEMRLARHGVSEVALKPFGGITARTHSLPVALSVSIEDISLNEARGMIERGWDVRKIAGRMKLGAAMLAAVFLLKLFALGALGGALGGILGRSVTAGRLAAGGAAGVCAVAVFLAALAIDFDRSALNRIEYNGAIEEAVQLLPAMQGALDDGAALMDRLERVSGNIADFYLKRDALARGGGGGLIRVLHISDLHNNLIAAKMVCDINKTLAPDMVLDTGDATDLGLSLELRLVNSLKCIRQPHVFVSGNHDLPKVIEELKSNFGAIVPDGAVVSVDGLRILGFNSPEPYSTSLGPVVPRRVIRRQRDSIARVLDGLPRRPDILMVHDPEAARGLEGRVPVILCGHTHEAGIRAAKGSLIVNAGSTGASGARYLLRSKDAEKTAKFTMAMITFEKRGARPVPLYADIIRLNEHTGGFSLKRTKFPVAARKQRGTSTPRKNKNNE